VHVSQSHSLPRLLVWSVHVGGAGSATVPQRAQVRAMVFAGAARARGIFAVAPRATASVMAAPSYRYPEEAVGLIGRQRDDDAAGEHDRD
jgi:hypothetical protein